jgi:hypothetical protein
MWGFGFYPWFPFWFPSWLLMSEALMLAWYPRYPQVLYAPVPPPLAQQVQLPPINEPIPQGTSATAITARLEQLRSDPRNQAFIQQGYQIVPRFDKATGAATYTWMQTGSAASGTGAPS